MENEEKKDNKKYIIIGVLILLLAGGAAFMMGSKNDTSVAPAASQGMPEVQKGKFSSLKDLLASTASTKCTVSSSNDQVDSQGTVYTSGGKMRGDFESTMKAGSLAGKKMTNHMIVDETTSYMWGDEMPSGIKMARTEVENATPQQGTTPANPNQPAIDMNQQSDYHCDSWSADASLFTPPSDVKFTDMSAMMKNIPKAPAVKGTVTTGTAPAGGVPSAGTGLTPEQKKEMCGACDQAGEGKAQCLQALGC